MPKRIETKAKLDHTVKHKFTARTATVEINQLYSDQVTTSNTLIPCKQGQPENQNLSILEGTRI